MMYLPGTGTDSRNIFSEAARRRERRKNALEWIAIVAMSGAALVLIATLPGGAW
jgi:hypothetical protein